MCAKDTHGWRMKLVFAATCSIVAFVYGQALSIHPTVFVSYNADCLTLELGRPCSVKILSCSSCHPSHSLSLTKKKSIPSASCRPSQSLSSTKRTSIICSPTITPLLRAIAGTRRLRNQQVAHGSCPPRARRPRRAARSRPPAQLRAAAAAALRLSAGSSSGAGRTHCTEASGPSASKWESPWCHTPHTCCWLSAWAQVLRLPRPHLGRRGRAGRR